MSIRLSIVPALLVLAATVACGKKGGSHPPPLRDDATAPTDSAPPPASTWSDPPREDGPARATQLALGSNFGCARMSDDTVRCWGGNDWGQLGTAAAPAAGASVTPAIDGVVEVAAGYAFTCARKRDHSVWCWGYDLYGELGKADESMSSAPVRIAGIDDAVDLAAGDRGGYVVRADGSVWSWGDNTYRQLGDGTATGKGPVRARVDGAVAVTGGMGGCARKLDGALWCWGMNLPDAPAPVAIGAPVVDVAIGGVFCAVTAAGEVRCWGPDDSGQLGRGDAPPGDDWNGDPAPVAGIASGATRVATDADHACALVGGKARCWGASWAHPAFPSDCLRSTAHTGGGGAPAQWEYCPTPTEVPGITGAIDVGVVSHGGGCVVTEPGKVWCWGPGPAAEVTL